MGEALEDYWKTLKLAKPEAITKAKIYTGAYFTLGEGRVFPLIGKTEGSFFPTFGRPKAFDMPSLQDAVFPPLARKNIASYPQTPLEAEILTQKDVLKTLGVGESDITKIDIVKEVSKEMKDIKSSFLSELPKESKAFDEGAMDIVWEYTKQKPESYIELWFCRRNAEKDAGV